jgi:hypothetical protein
MQVKKTKTGKLSIVLPLEVRERVWEVLCNMCEDQSVKQMINPLQSHEEITMKLYLATCQEILTSKSFHLQATWETRMLFKRSEAIVIMWLLRNFKELPLLDLKSSLHKSLL